MSPLERLDWLCAISADKKISSTASRVAVRLACYHNAGTGQCHPSRSRLAEDIGCGKRALADALKNLSENGYINIAHRFTDQNRQMPSRYLLNPVTMGVHLNAPVQQNAPSPVQQNAPHNKGRKEQEKKLTKKNDSRFVKPTVEEIRNFCQEHGHKIDAEYFFDYYETNGWVVGPNKKMKNWKSAIRNWVRRDMKTNKPRPQRQAL